MRKFYLIWRIWATTKNLQRRSSNEGSMLLEVYYADLYEYEYPKIEGGDAKDA